MGSPLLPRREPPMAELWWWLRFGAAVVLLCWALSR